MDEGSTAKFQVDDIFYISGRGVSLVGTVAEGTIIHGMNVNTASGRFFVTGIEAFRKIVDTAEEGMSVGILFAGAPNGSLDHFKGDYIDLAYDPDLAPKEKPKKKGFWQKLLGS